MPAEVGKARDAGRGKAMSEGCDCNWRGTGREEYLRMTVEVRGDGRKSDSPPWCKVRGFI